MTCGIWFPDQGFNLGPLHWEHGILATGPAGNPEFGFEYVEVEASLGCIGSRSRLWACGPGTQQRTQSFDVRQGPAFGFAGPEA